MHASVAATVPLVALERIRIPVVPLNAFAGIVILIVPVTADV